MEKPNRRRLVTTSVCTSMVLALALCGLCGCGLNEFNEQRARLKPLVERQASKQELMSVLGTNFLFYSKGRTNWEHLTKYLAREPANRLVAVREKASRWPNVMLYSTPNIMTWV